MNIIAKILLVVTLAGASAAASESPTAGAGGGKMYDLPAVDLTVKVEGGKVSGTILFYFLHRNTEHDPWGVDMKHSNPLPLIEPKFDGKTLSFQVSHKGAHPPRTLNDPPVAFEMRLTGEGEARLKNLAEDKGESLKMTRDRR